MEQTTIKIITLKEDIELILDSVPGSRPDIMQFCRDHRKPFLAQDRKPVFNIIQDELLGIYDPGPNHFFLRAEQIIRFAGFLNLRLPNTLALALKAEWEYFCCEDSLFQHRKDVNLEALLMKALQNRDGTYGFQPDTGQIYKLVKAIQFEGEEKASYGMVDLIIGEMSETMSFLGINSDMDQLYPVHELSERILLESCTDRERETYFRLKDLWYLRTGDVNDFIHLLERKKQLNLNIEEEYMRTFPEELNKKSELVYADEYYRLVLELRRAHPGFSLRRVMKMAEEMLVHQKQKRIEFRQKFMRSSYVIDLPRKGGSGSGVSDRFRKEYEEKCKALIRKIKKLLHTDKTRHIKGFSKQKEEEAIDLWMELMQATSTEKIFSFSSAMMLYSLPDYDHLLDIYKKACEIVGEDPEDYEIGDPLEFMIHNGRPITERIEFLEDELPRLEYQLVYLELKQFDYTGEQDALAYRIALNDPERHKQDLEKEIAVLMERIKETRKKIVSEYKQ